MSDETARAIDVDWGQFRLGNEVYEKANATFVRGREAPSIYDSNHVADIRAQTPAQIEELLKAADREFDYAGHRRVCVDFRTPPEFIARLVVEDGYKRDEALVMLLKDDLVGDAKTADIRPVTSDADWDVLWELMLQDWREHNERVQRTASDEVGRQMWSAKRRRHPPAQWWMAHVGEEPVAYLNSWEGIGGMGQVEDLFTLPAYRNRGLAKSLLHHCVADARAKGAGPVVIVADPEDTPKNLYHRMGWRPVALIAGYLKQVNI